MPEIDLPKPSSDKPPRDPSELKAHIPTVRKFIDDHRELFYTIARDRSLRFVPGPRSFIDLEHGEVNLGVKHWKEDMDKKGAVNHWQKVWITCHEIAHFRDLKENPEEMLANFKRLRKKAKEVAPDAIKAIKKNNKEIPGYLTKEIPVEKGEKMTALEYYIYQQLHRLYNSLDDIYVNKLVAQNSAVFDRRGSHESDVEELYRLSLFPITDYRKLPRISQFTDYFLRRTMVTSQEMILSPEVQEIVEGYSDEAARSAGITVEDEVRRITSLANPKSKDPGWRYKMIRSSIEPIYIELLLKDLEEQKFPTEEELKKMIQEGEGDKSDQDSSTGEIMPRSKPFSEGDIEKFAKKEKKEKEKREEREREKRLSPSERADRAQRGEDRRISQEYGVDEKYADEYRKIEQTIRPYVDDLAKVWEEVMKTISSKIKETWEHNYTSGRFNTDDFIKKYGAELAAEAYDAIPWEGLDVYDQRKLIERLSLFPEKIRLRLVLDGSGSMDDDRLKALKQLFVLINESLGSFEQTMNSRFKLKNPFVVDTEVIMFGSPRASVVIKPFTENFSPHQRMAQRFEAMGKITNGYGGTCDAEPFWGISQSINSELERRLKEGKVREFIFEITDGGSSTKQETRNAIDAVERKGAIARGFQIGDPDQEQREIFDQIWGKNGQHIPHPKDLAPAVAEILRDEITGMEVRIEYMPDYEGED